MEINQQNTYLYGFTGLFSLIYTAILWSTGSKLSQPDTFAQGATPQFFGIVLLGAILGLVVAVILKRLNNIAKVRGGGRRARGPAQRLIPIFAPQVFAQALHVPMQLGINSFIVAGMRLTWWKTGLGSVLIVAATMLYHFGGGWCVACGSALLACLAHPLSRAAQAPGRARPLRPRLPAQGLEALGAAGRPGQGARIRPAQA